MITPMMWIHQPEHHALTSGFAYVIDVNAKPDATGAGIQTSSLKAGKALEVCQSLRKKKNIYDGILSFLQNWNRAC